jgi:hypothetical protein
MPRSTRSYPAHLSVNEARHRMNHLQPLISLITAATECSIYAAPDAPGLTYNELIEIGSRLGHEEGEMGDAIASPLGHLEVQRGRYLPSSGIMGIYYTFHHTEEPDYRPVNALNFIHTQLQELARTMGAKKAGRRTTHLPNSNEVRYTVRLRKR